MRKVWVIQPRVFSVMIRHANGQHRCKRLSKVSYLPISNLTSNSLASSPTNTNPLKISKKKTNNIDAYKSKTNAEIRKNKDNDNGNK